VPDEPDMTVPVTRGEMHEALKQLGSEIVATLRSYLVMNLTAFEARLEEKLEQKFAVFGDEMRSLVKTSETKILTDVKAMFDPYRDTPQRIEKIEKHDLATRVDKLDEARLPDRVTKLEAKVFAPKRRATAARRKRS
jgi:hypothetical protein